MSKPLATCLFALLLACLPACGGGSSDGAPAAGPFDEAIGAQLQESYAELLLKNYADTRELTLALQADIAAFVAAPSSTTLTDCREAWILAREFYQQCEMSRFYGGPIDDDDGPEGLMNAWPLEESYIDYALGAMNTPLTSDAMALPAPITPVKLEGLNASAAGPDADPERNIATGWHAIEFLLWGQDLTAPGVGPGMRPHEDYIVAGGTAPNANEARRAEYLVAAVELLLENLQGLIDDWTVGGDYRMEWDALSPQEAATRILIGLGTLAFGELRGERLVAARLAADQEEEHSCFSDTTHLDHLYDIVGIANVWQGIYASGGGMQDHNGVGLRALALAAGGTHVADIELALNKCLSVSEDPLVIPFESAITAGGGSPESDALIEREVALSDLADALAALADALGLTGVTNDVF